MASTSVSSIQNSFKYDVFLSFRGEDTRKNFVDHLYFALTQKGIETYKDDENIKQGKMISDELINAIEDSKFYIIIFSKNYASSSWCLEELVKIMECRKGFGHAAYPVFYDVEPTEVRKQTGAVGDAFAKHKEEEAARKWREALKEASDLAGFELNSIANGHEATFIQKIVEEISLELCFINSSSDENLIGMETRVNKVISSLEPSVGDVRMLGIWGMGGAGKTTLARAIFDQISNQFEGESFLENVREVSKASLEGLKKLQKQLLSDVLKDQNIEVSSVSGGKSMMQRRMRSRKVLVVLDDVDHKDQLEALAGDCNWFKPGSRIIITTRDEQVLVAHRVSLIHNVNLLSQAEAGCLFSRYAFGRENPIQGYEELSGKVLHYAHGLPLTIKVLGSFLCGQSEPYWIDAIERLKKIPLTETMDRLEISFDGLEKEYKEIFLDVACILKGWWKEEAIRALKSRGFHAEVGLRVLEQKSLITIDERLGMHDHLEEMGRNIVRRLHPDEPNKHSRLWIDEEIEVILTNDLGTQATKCLYFRPLDFIVEIAMKGLANMKDLRFIDIRNSNSWIGYRLNWKFDKVSQYLPNSLQFVKWIGFPFSSLPNTFQGKYLVELDIVGGNIVQLWEDGEEKVLNNLRFLRIGSSKLRTFDLRLAPNLEQLTLDGCHDFVELHIPADHHPKLKYLTLIDSKLTNLHLGNTPNLVQLKLEQLYFSDYKITNLHFKNTPNLKNLTLQGCGDLVELQMPAESLRLEYVELSHSKLKTIHLGNTPNLVTLILAGCNNLEEFHMPSESLKLECLNLSHSKLKTLHLGSTPKLKELILKSCHDLVELQMPSGSLNLEYLYLSHSKLKTIHLGSTPKLKELKLKSCNDLVEFQMPAESLNLEYLYLSHSKLKTVHLLNTPNLEKLFLIGCNDLIELQMPPESLKLSVLNLSHSKLTSLHLANTPNLKALTLEGCIHLVDLQLQAESLNLEYLDLSHSKLKTLQLGNTPNLEKLFLIGCIDLIELQMPTESLKLEVLNLSHSKLINLHLVNTPNLKALILEGCNDLTEFQMPAESLNLEYLNLSYSKLKTVHLGNTQNLEKLFLIGCNDLIELQMPAESLKLEVLNLSHSKLTYLYLGNTPNLKALILEGCNDLTEFQMPAECLNLEYLNLSYSKLKTVHLGNTPNLEKLILKACNDLAELQMPAENLKLEVIDLSHSKLTYLYLGNTPNLKELILEGCGGLLELQMPDESLNLEYLDLSHSKLKIVHLGNTPNLEKLFLIGCKDLIELQMPVESLKLEVLNLSHSKLTNLHLRNTPNLERLILIDCHDLVELQMPSESPKLLDLDLSHSKLRTLDLGLTPNLKWLNLENCYDLVEINAPIGYLNKLAFLDLSGCGRFKSFWFDKQLNLNHSKKQLDSLSELHLIAETIDVCLLHPDNSFPKFRFECYYKEDPASSFGNLEMLISMGLCACTNLENFSRSICSLRGLRKLTLEGSIPEVPRDLDQLECLEELIFSSTNIRNLPDSICKLKHLKSLELKSCLLVKKLPRDLGRIESLETLTITDCNRLRDIPNNIGKIKCIVSPKVYTRNSYGKY